MISTALAAAVKMQSKAGMGVDDEDRIRPGWWVTRDKQHWRIEEMEDRHLLNTIRHLQRQGDAAWSEASAAASYPGNPESMGSYYADQAMDQMSDLGNARYAKRDELIKEAKRRKIWKGA